MTRRLTALAACAALALAPLAGCGGKAKKDIPRADSSDLISLLKTAKRQAAKNPPDCTGLASTIRSLAARVQGLPASVDSNTRDSLTNGVGSLQNLAAQQCSQTQTNTTTTPTTTTPTTTTETQTAPPQTTPTQTTPTNTTPTNTTPTNTSTNGGSTAPGAGGPGQGKSGNGKGKAK